MQTTHSETDIPSELKTQVDNLQKYTVNTYSRPPVIFTHGKGCKIWDSFGREYLDLTAGIAVNALGHSDPGVIDAITEQARNYPNVHWKFKLIMNLSRLINLCIILMFFSMNGLDNLRNYSLKAPYNTAD